MRISAATALLPGARWWSAQAAAAGARPARFRRRACRRDGRRRSRRTRAARVSAAADGAAEWPNLNGLWDYAITPADAPQPVDVRRRDPRAVSDRVAVERRRRVGRAGRSGCGIAARSRRRRCRPAHRLLLHFGAVDWEASVWVNGRESASTAAATTRSRSTSPTRCKPAAEQELVVAVCDPTDDGHAAARQAGAQGRTASGTRRHRHLADGLAGAGAGTARRRR